MKPLNHDEVKKQLAAAKPIMGKYDRKLLDDLSHHIENFFRQVNDKTEESIAKLLGISPHCSVVEKAKAVEALWASGRTIRTTYGPPKKTSAGYTIDVTTEIVRLPQPSTPAHVIEYESQEED